MIGDSPWPLKVALLQKTRVERHPVRYGNSPIGDQKKAVVLFEDGFEPLLAIYGIQFGCASFSTRAFSQKWVDLNHRSRNQTVRVTEENWNEAFLLSIRREAMY